MIDNETVLVEAPIAPEITPVVEPTTPPVEKGVGKGTKRAQPKKAKQGGKSVPRKERKMLNKPQKKRVPGPAMSRFKLKADPEEGVCLIRGCSTKASGRKWCKAHKKEIRKAQLKANNAVWNKRKKTGTAGHHVVYMKRVGAAQIRKPTEWALKAKNTALRQVERGHSIVKPERFKMILAKAAP